MDPLTHDQAADLWADLGGDVEHITPGCRGLNAGGRRVAYVAADGSGCLAREFDPRVGHLGPFTSDQLDELAEMVGLLAVS